MNREPKGRPIGGQFAKSKNPESGVDLSGEAGNEFESYLEQKALLRKASLAYYNSDDLAWDDVQYDQRLREIEALESEHPEWVRGDSVVSVASGADVSGDVIHSSPMLSLDNVFDAEQLRSWYDKHPVPMVVEPKLDGLAVVARYERGVLVQVATRGDGQSGEDVTDRGTTAQGLPNQLSEPIDIEIRGEIYMSDNDFERANATRLSLGKPAFVNPRNGAAGALRNQSDGAALPLSFACYDAPNLADTHTESMDRVGSLGVALARDVAQMPTTTLNSPTDIVSAVDGLGTRKSNLGFAIDGAVIKTDRMSDREAIGSGTRAPKWAIAYKYPAQERLTKLLEIIPQMGRTGAVTPRARVEPVEVGGVTIEYVTLHNWELATERDFRIGDTVSIRRAGEVIPELVAPLVSARDGSETSIISPQECPRCGGPLDQTDKRWRCLRGRDCGLSESINYAVGRDALDIEGLGPTVTKALTDSGLVHDLADLFDINEDQLAGLERVGPKSAQNIKGQIDKARSQSRARLITALGIRGTGRSMSRRLASRFDSLESLSIATANELSNIEGIGPEKAALIRSELDELAPVINKLVERGITGRDATAGQPVQTSAGRRSLAGTSVVFTGAMTGPFAAKSRNEMNELVEAQGGVASSSVSSKTGILVVGQKAGSKKAAAEKLGIRVMTEEEFARYLEESE